MSEILPVNGAPTAPAVVAAAVPAGWYLDSASKQNRWWDGQKWTEHFAPTVAPTQVVVVNKKQTNHVFHLLMTILTVGLWIPVWIIVAIVNA